MQFDEVMSKSIHTTYQDLNEATKSELIKMVEDSDSVLHQLADKRALKKKVRKERKEKKIVDKANIKLPNE